MFLKNPEKDGYSNKNRVYSPKAYIADQKRVYIQKCVSHLYYRNS